MTDILSLHNWTAFSVEESDDTIIHAEFKIQPDKCPRCSSNQLYKHGTNPVIYRDIPRHMKSIPPEPVIFVVEILGHVELTVLE